jgi:hypothetical protein
VALLFLPVLVVLNARSAESECSFQWSFGAGGGATVTSLGAAVAHDTRGDESIITWMEGLRGKLLYTRRDRRGQYVGQGGYAEREKTIFFLKT